MRTLTVIAVTACAFSSASCGGSGDGSSSGANGYVYLASPGALTLYSVDPSTAGLAGEVNTLFTDTSESIWEIAIDPSGQFLYLLDAESGVHVYAIAPMSGGVTEVPGSPFGYATTLAFDASGRYVYLFNEPIFTVQPTTISAYSIAGSGALTLLATYTIPLPGTLGSVISAGNHLYAVDAFHNSIIAFSIASTGELSQNVPGSPFATDTYPYSIVADPSGTVLYTANLGRPTATNPAPGSISSFTIDSSTGALSPAQGSPQPIPAGGTINIDPRGKFLFVPVQGKAVDAGTVGVSVYAINSATAALSAVAGSPFPAGSNPGVAITDPTERVVYVLDQGTAEVTELSLEATGVLTPLAGSPVVLGSIVECMAFASP